MRVLIDECLPRHLKKVLVGHFVQTVREAGWSGFKNGQLLALAEPNFDAFITADRNLRYQQNLDARRICILELPTNKLSSVMELAPAILRTPTSAKPGDYIELGDED